MTPDDLSRIHHACFTAPRPWSASEIAELLAQTGVFLTEAPSGFAMARVIADEAEILTVAVDPKTRRRGIGRQLMSDLIAEAAERGAASLFLEVAETNTAARALYDTLGFRQTGRRKGYFHHPDGTKTDAIVLSRLATPMP